MKNPFGGAQMVIHTSGIELSLAGGIGGGWFLLTEGSTEFVEYMGWEVGPSQNADASACPATLRVDWPMLLSALGAPSAIR
jgi:hypothetical protein